MKAAARFLGHPVHQMLIVLPLGSLAASIVFDILNRVTSSNRWADAAFWTLGFGVVTALCAAVFGVVDWVKIPKGTRAKRIGAIHGIGNVAAVVLFAISFVLRMPDPAQAPGDAAPQVPLVAVVLSFIAGGMMLVTGWLGGELVNRLGVGVYDDANVDAPSSLRPFTRAGLNRREGRWAPGRDVDTSEPGGRAGASGLRADVDAPGAAGAGAPPPLPSRHNSE